MREHTWITPLLWQTSVRSANLVCAINDAYLANTNFGFRPTYCALIYGNQTLPSCTLCGCKQVTRRSCQYFSTMPKSVIRWANRMPRERASEKRKSCNEKWWWSTFIHFVVRLHEWRLPLPCHCCSTGDVIFIHLSPSPMRWGIRHMPPQFISTAKHTRTCNDDNDFRRNTLVYSRSLSLPLSFAFADHFFLIVCTYVPCVCGLHMWIVFSHRCLAVRLIALSATMSSTGVWRVCIYLPLSFPTHFLSG